jgi:hypothetical protein
MFKFVRQPNLFAHKQQQRTYLDWAGVNQLAFTEVRYYRNTTESVP